MLCDDLTRVATLARNRKSCTGVAATKGTSPWLRARVASCDELEMARPETAGPPADRFPVDKIPIDKLPDHARGHLRPLLDSPHVTTRFRNSIPQQS
jgi:hypothetical protein